MAFALRFSESVNNVAIRELKLGEQAMDRIEAIAQDADPLGRLWEQLTGTRTAQLMQPSPRASIVVAKGAKVQFVGIEASEAVVVTIRESYEGVVMVDEPKRHTVDVYLPGMGFGRVTRSSISKKRQRDDSSQQQNGDRWLGTTCGSMPIQLNSLELDVSLVSWQHERDSLSPEVARASRARLLRFMKLLSPSKLHALRLESSLLDEDLISSCLKYFCNLQSLRVKGGTLKSMQVFTDAYEKHACQVSSLQFDGGSVPIDEFDAFLRQFLTDSSIKKHVKKLRFVDEVFTNLRKSTATLIANVLRDKMTFNHLHIKKRGIYPSHDFQRGIRWRTKQYHKQLLPTPLPLKSRVAFLSVVRQLSETNSHVGITEDLAASIFEFAAPLTHERTVNIEDEPDNPWWM